MVRDLNRLLRSYERTGYVGAMEKIVAATRGRLLATARRIGDPQDAEDTVQATYHALLRRRRGPLDGPLIAWLITVTVRIAYRQKAARRRETALNETFKRAGVDALSLSTEEDLVRAIVRFATLRQQRRR